MPLKKQAKSTTDRLTIVISRIRLFDLVLINLYLYYVFHRTDRELSLDKGLPYGPLKRSLQNLWKRLYSCRADLIKQGAREPSIKQALVVLEKDKQIALNRNTNGQTDTDLSVYCLTPTGYMKAQTLVEKYTEDLVKTGLLIHVDQTVQAIPLPSPTETVTLASLLDQSKPVESEQSLVQEYNWSQVQLTDKLVGSLIN